MMRFVNVNNNSLRWDKNFTMTSIINTRYMLIKKTLKNQLAAFWIDPGDATLSHLSVSCLCAVACCLLLWLWQCDASALFFLVKIAPAFEFFMCLYGI